MTNDIFRPLFVEVEVPIKRPARLKIKERSVFALKADYPDWFKRPQYLLRFFPRLTGITFQRGPEFRAHELIAKRGDRYVKFIVTDHELLSTYDRMSCTTLIVKMLKEAEQRLAWRPVYSSRLNTMQRLTLMMYKRKYEKIMSTTAEKIRDCYLLVFQDIIGAALQPYSDVEALCHLKRTSKKPLNSVVQLLHKTWGAAKFPGVVEESIDRCIRNFERDNNAE